MSLLSITLLLLFATATTVRSKEIKIFNKIFDTPEIDVSRGRPEESVIMKKSYRPSSPTHDDSSKVSRTRRHAYDPWIVKDFEGFRNLTNYQALVVRDEKIPPCGITANLSTNSRYFMCSGAILTERHAITTASCIHFAHVYEHHVEGDLAILIGAATDYNQVIRIARVEVHPYYDYDIESPLYALHNLAILHLECPICNGFARIPKLPSNPYQDLGHLCCSDRCQILTVVQRSNNRHVFRILKTKHLPSPEHKENEENISSVDKADPSRSRLIRSSGKLASAPLFFTRDSGHPNLTNHNEDRHVKRNRFTHGDGRRSEKKENSSNVDANKKVLDDFTKRFVDAMISRLEDFLRSADDAKTPPAPESGVGSNLTENATSADMAEALVNTLVSGVLHKIDVTDEATYEMTNDILEMYVDCPPLGTPVIRDDILIGMVAYTCDDVQDWVPWKYVEISKNIDWITDRMKIVNGESTENDINKNRPSRSKMSISTICHDPVQGASNPCVTSMSERGDGACETRKEGDFENSKVIEEITKNSKIPYNGVMSYGPIKVNG